MSSCYSGDHIAEDYIHTDITTLNIEEPQQKNRLGTVSIKFPKNINVWEIYVETMIR